MTSKPWTVQGFLPRTSDVEPRGELHREFDTVTEALKFIEETGTSPEPELELDPEDQADLWLDYTEPSRWTADMGDYALVANRIVCKIVNGWAGGQANYQLEVFGQWGKVPVKFWVAESDVTVFSKEHL